MWTKNTALHGEYEVAKKSFHFSLLLSLPSCGNKLEIRQNGRFKALLKFPALNDVSHSLNKKLRRLKPILFFSWRASVCLLK